jgi:hypothetical protein
MARQAESLTQLGRFGEAAASLHAAVKLAQRGAQQAGGCQQPQASSRDGDGGDGARTVAALEARRARVLYLETQFAALDSDSAGAEAGVEAEAAAPKTERSLDVGGPSDI